MNDDFYRSIDPVESFEALASGANYVALPVDWWIVAADVVNSTTAIAAGNYKAVNTVGVSVIAATVNVLRPVEIPYMFGGDGALLCVPGWSIPKVRNALAATLAMARESFDLQLRAAVIPATYLRDRGNDILVARHRVSEHYVQCAFFGKGPEFAESELKSGKLPEAYQVFPDQEASADYTGLECRWQEIPSSGGETVAIIVNATGPGERSLSLYRTIIQAIARIYGEADYCRPVTKERVRAAFSRTVLRNELGVQAWRRGLIGQMLSLIGTQAAVLLGWFLMKFKLTFNNADWGTYKKDLVANTDFRKFDGSLRLVLSGNETQRTKLESFLSKLKSEGQILYGIHVADSALMTCLVEQRQSVHFHFIDAAGGGYAAAAKIMKYSEHHPRNR
ncbi:MAG: DUF3095 domain-containing protein [Bacteroidota bacterium]